MSTAYDAQFEALAPGGVPDGPSWLSRIRRSAIARFQLLGFPTTKNEDWHFTSVAPIAEATLTPMRGASGTLTRQSLDEAVIGDPSWPTLVFVNGRYSSALSHPGAMGDGIRAMSLAAALHEEPTLLEKHLTRSADYDDHAFSALNTALMQDGAVIRCGHDRASDVPIHLIFVADANAEQGVTHPRNLIVVDRNASLRVIEQYVSIGDAAYFTNALTEVVVGEGATLHHYKLQREGKRAMHVGRIVTVQSRDSHLVSFSYARGASLSRTNIETILAGEGCGATLNGLLMLEGTQHGDHQTRIEHAQPNCYSREMYKAVLDDAAHGVFNGKVYVEPIAQKTDGKQTNNTLLLSDRARMDSKPQLEIFADDVKCTHGATIGQLDTLALFYLKSRGITPATAQELLTYAFAAEVIETIPIDALRLGLEEEVRRLDTKETA